MRKLWLMTIVLAIFMMSDFACQPKPKEFTLEESEKVARQFVEREATFRFDGMPETLKLEKAELESPGEWQFRYAFTSRHSGYGDRTGQILLQVLTPHEVKVEVTQGKVTKAEMDERWDMVRQRFLPGRE
ncbi:MAG: hypothetical protein HYX81_03635 [Chloroflexi bacterium]|nr:hypothetical protein [Chloroflexota bacterium]